MNWGLRILILYLGFVALILSLVFTCFGHDTELEYKDYYARELRFQEQINARDNALALTDPIEVSVDNKQILLELPADLSSQDTKGEITLMRPSDAKLDKTVPLKVDEKGKQMIGTSELKKGVYKLRLNLNAAGKNYYHESIVNIR